MRRLAIPIIALLGACTCSKRSPAPSSIACFDTPSTSTSAGARAIFDERHCQGGGVTWAALIRTLVGRRGKVEPLEGPAPEFTGDVSMLDGRARFSIDDEADDARFCTDDPNLLSAVRADYERLNTDANLLRKAMSETPHLDMECFDGDGSVAEILSGLRPPPTLPVDQARAAGAIARLKEAIRTQPAWCFPGGAAFDGSRGALRFTPDDCVIYTPPAGGSREGAVTWPRPGNGDDRLQITVPTLLHLDVGATDRLGRDLVDSSGTIREELVPGDGCLARSTAADK